MSRKKKESGHKYINIQNTTIFEPVILTGFCTSVIYRDGNNYTNMTIICRISMFTVYYIVKN